MNDHCVQVDLLNSSSEEESISRNTPGPVGKKVYIPPTLGHQAHLRDMTLAPSPGVHESGVGDGRKALSSGSGSSSERNTSDIFENDIFD